MKFGRWILQGFFNEYIELIELNHLIELIEYIELIEGSNPCRSSDKNRGAPQKTVPRNEKIELQLKKTSRRRDK